MKAQFIRNIRAVIARAYVRVVGVNREWHHIVFEIILPLLSVATFVYIYIASAPETFRNSLVVRVIIGGAMTAFWANVLWGMAANFYFEKETGNLEIYLMAPISRWAILLGMALGGMFNTTLRAIATVLLGAVVFGAVFTLANPFILLAIFFLTLVALYGMGMMFASLFLLYGREAWHTVNLLEQPIYLVSGFYFPVRFLGYYAAFAASLIPITIGLDGMNQILGGSYGTQWGFLPIEQEVIILFLLGIFFLFGANKALAYMENLSKREGRLTLKQL